MVLLSSSEGMRAINPACGRTCSSRERRERAARCRRHAAAKWRGWRGVPRLLGGVQAAGAETQLFVAPDQPHNFRRLSYQLFKINTELSWFAEHAGLPPYRPVLPQQAFQPDERDSDTPEGVNEPEEEGVQANGSPGP